MLKGLFILDTKAYRKIYGLEERAEIEKLVDIYCPQQTAESIRTKLSMLAEAQVIFSGWGAPVMDEKFLAAAPNLKAVFYGAGTIRGFVTDQFWRRAIVVTAAAAANAVPVSEYTLSVILLSLKRFWAHASAVRAAAGFPKPLPVPGAYQATIGLVSLGLIGRLVRDRLLPFDLRVVAYDPLIAVEEAKRLRVDLLPLEELFRTADVISLHAPWLPATEGMITGSLIAAMKQNATIINTSRGAIVRESEMIEVLKKRDDLYAVLDVTDPEPPLPDSPLYRLPNVVLTPHIAGSMDAECRRMGRLMVEELRRYVAGDPLEWAITQERAAVMA
ncbi:MAG TPA: hydroxyacid dehydrogenase [Spirochaetia bacterium]|nr:hydroxyacid dehydrogenase [Spirochaetia bacterium]